MPRHVLPQAVGPGSKGLSEQRGEIFNVGAMSGVGRLWTGSWPFFPITWRHLGEDKLKSFPLGQMCQGSLGVTAATAGRCGPCTWLWCLFLACFILHLDSKLLCEG